MATARSSDRLSDRPTEADDLYALEPAAFIEARNALVRKLRSEKRREDATAVSGLRRPTPTAWALNMVAREQPDLVEQALGAGHRLRDATEAAVGGQADELRSASAADQAASGAVVEAAVKHLGARGPGLTPTVRATLRAAVLADDLADELRRGVLATEHEAGGFEFGEGFTVAPGAKAGPARKTPTSRAAAPASEKSDKSEASGKAQASENRGKSDTAARRRAHDEERAAQKARRAELQANVKARREEASELEREAKAQERAARSARTAADRAARALEAAQHELDQV